MTYDSKNRLSYTKDEYKQLENENERLKKAIKDFGNNPAGFDWGILGRIDDLENLLESVAGFMGHLEQSEYAEEAMTYRADIEHILDEEKS